MTNKVIREASKCANCVAEKSRFLEEKPNKKINKKPGWDKINPKLFIYETQFIIKHVDMLFEVQKNTEYVDPKVLKTKNGRTMLLSKCAVCSNKKPRFMKE